MHKGYLILRIPPRLGNIKEVNNFSKLSKSDGLRKVSDLQSSLASTSNVFLYSMEYPIPLSTY